MKKAKQTAKQPAKQPVKLAFLDGDGGLLRRGTCSYWEKFSHWFALILLLVFPLTPGVEGYYNITATKYDVFKWLTVVFVILCALILGGLFLEKKLLRARAAGGWQKLTLPQILLMAFLLWSILSAILSPYPFGEVWRGQGRHDGLLCMLLYGAVFLLLSFWGEYSDRFPIALAAMTVILDTMMLMQIGGSSILYPEGMNYANTRFLGTIGNVDCVSGIVSVVAPALACGYVLLNTKWRYLCLPGYAMLLYVQLFTGVDTGKIGLAAAVVVVLPFLLTKRRHIADALIIGAITAVTFAAHKAIVYTRTVEETTATFTMNQTAWLMVAAALVLLAVAALLYWRDKKRGGEPLPIKPKTIRLAVAAIEVVVIIVALIFLYNYSGEHRLLVEMSQILHGELSDRAGSGRGIVWKNCITLIRETPIIGSGPGTFAARHEPYNTTQFFDFAHNDFLQIGVCQGLVGLALYVAFLVSLAVRVLRVAPRCPQIVIFGGAAVGYLVYSFFVFSIAIVSPLFWVMAGIMDKMVRQVQETEKLAQK